MGKLYDTSNLPWVEKYRPKSLDDILAHHEIIKTIKKFIEINKLPHILFFGPPGTGKTSLILAIARQIYGLKISSMVLDLNASDDRGIEIVRQEIQDFSSSKRVLSTVPKLVILDECDSMTKDAQFALRRVIEKHTRNTRFCLICNYVSKIIPALQSRCTRFRFAPLHESHVRNKINQIVEQEKILITKNSINAVIRLGRGDMRRMLNMIQSAHMTSKLISEDMIYDCIGIPTPKNIESIISWLFNATFTECISYITEIQTTRGFSLMDILDEVQNKIIQLDIPSLRKINLLEALSDAEYLLAIGSNESLQLASLVGSFIEYRNVT